MRKYLISSQPPATAAAIETIENDFGISLPSSYKEFLMVNNGGLARSNDRRFRDSVFFAVADTPNSLSSEIFERTRKDRIPVASNLAGDYLYVTIPSFEVFLGDSKVAENFEKFVKDFLLEM